MKLTLLCEQCNVRHVQTKLGVFHFKDLSWPMDLSIFKSWNSDLLPDPFPSGLVDSWEWARCRQCRGRPFLNTVEQPDGSIMVVDGSKVPQGHEGRLLTEEMGYIPIPDYPNAPEFIITEDGVGQVVTTAEKEPTKSGPVQCPVCGKDYQSQVNLDRYHNCKGSD